MVTYQADDMDLLFRALGHGVRRRVLDLLKAGPGQNVGEIAAQFGMSRIAVMKHLAVLSEAGLVTSEKVGRERRLYLNPVPIQRVQQRWLSGFTSFWAEHMLDVKARVEAGAAVGAGLHAGRRLHAETATASAVALGDNADA